ncbi:cyclic-di-AMP receptor [Flavonifractor sp. An100]|uniref:cyclic-di-AMP receptor n=1 Tax=Flavonifractor sp. An100 TaxID=1965538 RepID=UPI000B36FD7E|nr:cyclic-di-AMP receptor [Flavonifractor sp. An100]OUQ78593.1 transcriptional regulator [Flavonifractor sp. An100]
MKLIFAVIRDKDANDAVEELIERRIGVTKLASTGGFLRDGNTTLMIGTEDNRVEEVMQALKETCAKRSQMEVVAPHATGGVPVWNLGYAPVKVEVGGATVFVLDVEQFRKL